MDVQLTNLKLCDAIMSIGTKISAECFQPGNSKVYLKKQLCVCVSPCMCVTYIMGTKCPHKDGNIQNT